MASHWVYWVCKRLLSHTLCPLFDGQHKKNTVAISEVLCLIMLCQDALSLSLFLLPSPLPFLPYSFFVYTFCVFNGTSVYVFLCIYYVSWAFFGSIFSVSFFFPILVCWLLSSFFDACLYSDERETKRKNLGGGDMWEELGQGNNN